MTVVHVDLRKPQRGTAVRAPVYGTLEVSLYRRRIEDDAFVLTTRFSQVLVEGLADLVLSPTDGTNAWQITERVPNGITRLVAVPSQDEVDYVDLVDVAAGSLTPTPDAMTAWAELGARVNALPKVVALTQAAYDALSSPDSTTLYLITS